MSEREGPPGKVEESLAGTTESLPIVPVVARVPVGLYGIERFTIMKKLGEGGMGSVYAAYDSVLDRKVAVKVVRPDLRKTAEPTTRRDQLLREAQAMARLSHPNVVAVHEVGELGDDIYVVLDFVDGATLWEWMRERERSWREVVAAFIDAGRGLAAAHEAGLVHRDFKPTNVLIGRDGRIQVTDFGVVSMGRSSPETTPSGKPVTPAGSELVGKRVGTPAYMAPEQHAAVPVDARADQFSFCVALWEALYKTRPFAGHKDLIAAIRDGLIEIPKTSRVPRWLEAALRRGLSARPEDRWPSMDDLLAELARDPERVRLRRIIATALATAMATTAIVAWVGWTRRPPAIEPCAGADAYLVHRWDPERAAAVRSAFAASQLSYAETAGARVIGQLDAWAPRWVAMRTEACRATRVTGEQSEALLDARMRCLDRELDEVGELATALVTSDREMIAHASEKLALPDLAACADRDVVMARIPPPWTALARGQVQRIEHELASLAAAERTGRYHDARVRAVKTATDAKAVGFQPLVAESLFVLGRLEEQDGDLAAAQTTLTTAAHVAGAARDDRMVASTLVALVEVLVERAELPAALAIGVAADAATARGGDRVLEAELEEQLGTAHEAAGDPDAEPHLRRALALREAIAGVDSVPVAQVLNKLASLDARHGRTSEARDRYERAFRIVTAQLGSAHPATAITHANLCFLDAEAGDLAKARTCQEDVLAVLESTLGADHPQVAWALNEVALVQREQGDLDGAEPRFRRALAIWEHASGRTHPDVAWPLVNLGEIADARGDHAGAEALCRRALETVEHASGPSHADTVPALACLSEAVRSRSPRDAVVLAQRALDTLHAHGSAPDAAIEATLARAQAAAGRAR